MTLLISYTNFIALLPPGKRCFVEGNEQNKVGVRDIVNER